MSTAGTAPAADPRPATRSFTVLWFQHWLMVAALLSVVLCQLVVLFWLNEVRAEVLRNQMMMLEQQGQAVDHLEANRQILGLLTRQQDRIERLMEKQGLKDAEREGDF